MANVFLDKTLDEMATERLKQFTEDYDALVQVKDETSRIMMKNHLFMVYDKVLRK